MNKSRKEQYYDLLIEYFKKLFSAFLYQDIEIDYDWYYDCLYILLKNNLIDCSMVNYSDLSGKHISSHYPNNITDNTLRFFTRMWVRNPEKFKEYLNFNEIEAFLLWKST